VAKVEGIPTQEQLAKLKKGVKDDGEWLKAVNYTIQSKDKQKNTAIIELTLHEGKNRHVRGMMEGLGLPVQKLNQKQYGILNLEGIASGKCRELNHQEKHQLLMIAHENVTD